MKGIEMMLGSMIGMKPEQMKAKVTEFEGFVRTGMEALASIAETQKEILARLDAMEASNNG